MMGIIINQDPVLAPLRHLEPSAQTREPRQSLGGPRTISRVFQRGMGIAQGERDKGIQCVVPWTGEKAGVGPKTPPPQDSKFQAALGQFQPIERPTPWSTNSFFADLHDLGRGTRLPGQIVGITANCHEQAR
jgi:hypothetical protein